MALYDFSAPRLYVEPALSSDAIVPLDRNQQNYLCNVLRLQEGQGVLAFNGRDGEWQAVLAPGPSRKQVALRVGAQTRLQTPGGNLHYLFAPLKHARLDYMVQKAVEMGVASLRPVTTRRTQTSRVNAERMRANIIEAAEQCGILAIPGVHPAIPLERALADWPAGRWLVFCDEDAESADPAATLAATRLSPHDDLAVLIGPEGGFDPAERAALLAMPSVLRLSLGPRILRADTAAVAALALIQATLGDWRRTGAS